jgi:membrane protease YdiL (CAAX protease family)
VRFVPYVCLSAAIVSLWLTRGLNRLITLAAFLILAIGSGVVAHVLSPTALLPIAAFGALCWVHSLRLTRTMRVPLAIAVVVASLALMAHVVPGFSNLLIVKDAIVSRDGVPFTLYFNFDKALIGLFLLAFAIPLITSRAEWLAMLRAALPRIIVVIAVVLAAAFALGHVRFEAEEAVFRGVIQWSLANEPRHESLPESITALLIAAVLFGAVHFAGGPRAIAMATIAGAGYGWVYWRSGYRIEASILAHFLLNATHILFFTYPMLAVPLR